MNGVCGIIVTYHPGREVLENIAAFQRQVERVVVVDNASSAASQALLACLPASAALELILNEDNRGIAAAFNQGIARAFARDFEWVATFDQDSRVPEDFVAGLLRAHAAFPRRENVAVVAPLYRDRHLGNVYSPSGPVAADASGDVAVNVTASSGNLVATRALRAVGAFREDFFIDCVDFEFCLRCRRQGWLVLEARGVRLEHAQGHWRQFRWLWKTPRINDYGPVRRYYQARNRLVMYARFATFDPRWTFRDATGFGCDFIKLLLFCENRGIKVQAMLTGVWHALIGRLGPWRPPARFTK